MALFNVTAEYLPNGNKRSAPIVADDADDAKNTAEVRWDIAENDPLFKWDVTPANDPDGRTEQLLKEGEIRRLEAEFYAR